MIAYGIIVEDLHYAVAELNEVCERNFSSQNVLISSMQDAGKIFAFLYCGDVLQVLLYSIYADNFNKELVGDIEDLLEGLKMAEVLNELEYMSFMSLFGIATLMEIDPTVGSDEMILIYNDGLTLLPACIQVMRDFHTKIYKTYDLYDLTEAGADDE